MPPGMAAAEQEGQRQGAGRMCGWVGGGNASKIPSDIMTTVLAEGQDRMADERGNPQVQ